MNIDYVLTAHGILGSRKKDNVAPSPINNFKVTNFGDGFVTLVWNNPVDADFVGVRIQCKTGGYPISERDGKTVYDGIGTSVKATGLTNDIKYYFRAFTYDKNNNFNGDLGQQIAEVPTAYDDQTNAPGPKKLISGTTNLGFFGEVPASEFITGDALCSKLGITEGTSQFSNEPWLKFALDCKILFRPKKAIRHSISWDHINSKNCVYGDKVIEIGGVKYKVRLMKGALTDSSKYSDSDRGAKGSEWNRLMLPIHIRAKDKSWTYPQYVEDNVPYWGIDYTNSDLQLGSGNGRRVWCQEKSGGNYESRVVRGLTDVSNSDSWHKSAASDIYGFVPVLEVVSD